MYLIWPTCFLFLGDISGKWKMSGTPLTKDGKTFVKIENFLFRPKVGSMKIYASNLFTGNEALSTYF